MIKMTWDGLTSNSFWYDEHRLLFNRDSRSMVDLPDETVQMVVTSPPYWGLRKYSGLPDLIWGGEKECQHHWRDTSIPKSGGVGDYEVGRVGNAIARTASHERKESSSCSLCGAWKGQLGLEPNPEMYVQHTIKILREIRRVLRKDGVVFWNIGDSYAGSNSGKGDYRKDKGLQKDIYDYEHPQSRFTKWRRGEGGEEHGVSLSGIPLGKLKSKDLCLIPFRVAISAQEDGWWVRSVIIWSKPNPMPESVTDRPTESHEYILLLTKSAKYYWDAEAVRETSTDPESFSGRRWRSYSRDDYSNAGLIGKFGDTNPTKDVGAIYPNRNLRSVWTFPTQPYPEAHFACVDSETEILTIEGWKRYTDIKQYKSSPQHILVATYNLERQVIEYQRLSYIKEYDCEELVKVGNRDLDIRMTNNHRNVVNKRTGEEQVVLAKDLSYSDKIRVSAPIIYPENNGIGVNLAELVGWIISEGHYKKGGYIEIYQNEGEKARRIDYLIARLEIPHTRHVRRGNQVSWFLKKSPLVEWCLINIPGKRLNRFLVSLPVIEIIALFNGLVGGDGCVRKDDGRITFIQKDKVTKDWFQILALRLGYHSIQSNNRVYLTKRTHIGIRKTNGEGKAIETIKYTGKVWCPKTPNGTWVARRNGRIFITGNTYPEKLVEICVKAGTPEVGCCSKCGKPWGRIMEKSEIIPLRGKSEAYRKSNSEELVKASALQKAGWTPGIRDNQTLGWQPQCKCNADKVPSIVLDPFAGSGTTLKVAAELNRRAIGYELSQSYCQLAMDRNKQGVLG